MVGIISYGGYIPWYRINRMTIYGAIGSWLSPASLLPGEISVSNWDEDSVSMAVNAAIDCVDALDRTKIDALYFATTTSPFGERKASGIIATSLLLRPDIRTSDISSSVSAATTAVLAAADSVKAGSARSIMVTAADSRLAKAGGSLEEQYGDAAAALLIGNEGVIATIDGSYSVSHDFLDHFRVAKEKYNRQWEDRWIRDEGYGKFINEAIAGLMKKCGVSAKDISKVCYPCLYTRAHVSIGKDAGFKPEQIQDHMFNQVGNTGTPYPLMILIAALEDAKPGDRIIVASYGNGSDAILLTVTKELEKAKDRRGIKKSLAFKKDIGQYERFITCRDVLPIDTAGRGEETALTSASALWRERRDVLGMMGSKCKRCGTPQYPAQHICANPACQAVDEMEDYPFSDKTAKVFTYTGDLLAFSPNPPAIYGVINFDGGGRYIMDFTDCEIDKIKVGQTVVLSFRRKYVDRIGLSGYFWKAKPITG